MHSMAMAMAMATATAMNVSMCVSVSVSERVMMGEWVSERVNVSCTFIGAVHSI